MVAAVGARVAGTDCGDGVEEGEAEGCVHGGDDWVERLLNWRL